MLESSEIFLSLFAVGSQQKKPDEKEFICPEGAGNGNFADPATCRRFYQVKLKIVKRANINLTAYFINLKIYLMLSRCEVLFIKHGTHNIFCIFYFTEVDKIL
jgi:hypothetical protein